MDTSGILIFVFIFGLVAVIVIIGYSNSRSKRAAWGELASQTGLNFVAGNFLGKPSVVSGIYRGHSLALDTFSRGGGEDRTTYTRIVLGLKNPTQLTLSISEEGVGSKLKKLFGAQEILVGDEAIDAKFFIKGSPEMAVQRLLTNTSLRQKLLESKSLHIELGNRILYEKRGYEGNPEKLRFVFDLLVDMAEVVGRLE